MVVEGEMIGQHRTRQGEKLAQAPKRLRVKVLIDSGAERSLVSQQLVEKHALVVEEAPHTRFLFANGHEHVSAQAARVMLTLGEYEEQLVLQTCSLTSYDVILGRTWLQRHNPSIDWRTGGITLPDSRSILRAGGEQRENRTPAQHEEQQQSAPIFTIVSAKAFCRTMRKGYSQACLVEVADRAAEVATVGEGTASGGSERRAPTTEVPASALPELAPVLREYRRLFSPPASLPPLRDADLQHHIKLRPGSEPPAKAPYRLSWAEQEALQKILVDLMGQGLVVPSTSPFAAPVLLVKKKDGSFRLCVDYRLLNKETVRDRFPLPHIRDLLDKLRGAKYFTKIDLRQGYWQVRMAPRDEPKTAFVTPTGTYQFRVLPMGLCNAPATFQRVMTKVLGKLTEGADACVVIYLDDLLIFSRTATEHAHHVKQVLAALADADLRLHPSKCAFGVQRVVFLGHTVTPDHVAVEEEKVAVLRQWKMPTSRVALQRFLGFANFYRSFVKDFAHIAAPLTDLLQCGGDEEQQRPLARLVITPAARTAFNVLKNKLMTAPVLALPNPQRPFTIHADASAVAVGAVLEQDGHPVAYASKRFNAAETNYAIRDKELLAQVFALQHWRVYLLGGPPCTIYTDHASLSSFSTAELSSGRLARWATLMQDYNYNVVYRAGAQNRADALTRMDNELPTRGETTAEGVEVVAPVSTAVVPPPPTLNTPLLQQYPAAEDAYFHRVVKGLTDPAYRSTLPRTWQQRLLRFQVQHNTLYLREESGEFRRCIPSSQRHNLLQEMHSTPIGGHCGTAKLYATIRPHAFWPRMAATVAQFVRECDTCQRTKANHHPPQPPAEPIAAPSRPWEMVSLDFLDLPMSSRGHDAALTVVDTFSNYTHIIPTTRAATAEEAATLFVEEVVRLHGVPKALISDRDSRFTSALWQDLWRQLGTTLRMTTAHRPQADGRAERANRTVQTALRAVCNSNGTDWDAPHVRSMLELGLNSKVNPSTGMTPFQAVQGYEPLTPTALVADTPTTTVSATAPATQRLRAMQEVWAAVRNSVTDAQERQRRKQPGAEQSPAGLQVGDEVLLSTEAYPNLRAHKLQPPFVGPFRITARPSPSTATLQLPPAFNIHNTINVRSLKPYAAPASAPPAPPPVGTTAQGESLWEIEKIVGERMRRGRKQYKVRWKGYGVQGDTWEPESELAPFHLLLAEFHATRPASQRAAPRGGAV